LLSFLRACASLEQKQIEPMKINNSSMGGILSEVIEKQGKVKVIEFQIRQCSRNSAGNN